jgi:hypothetical protein
MIAAVGTDGTRPVVWGLGSTSYEAAADAARWGEPDGNEELTYHEITPQQAAVVQSGDVSWPIVAAAFQIQVTGEWAGTLGGWRPAIAGTVNQTGESDAAASTFTTHDEASIALDRVIGPQLASDAATGDPRDNAPRFRIVAV